MMRPNATILPCGKRLHLQHGPIDLIVSADQNRQLAFSAATKRFETVLEELVAELPQLRAPLTPKTSKPYGSIAKLMHDAASPYSAECFVTRMAAVAGAVADTVLDAMKSVGELKRAYVNNGGDIAIHLENGQKFISAMASHTGHDLGRISITANDQISGIATSGRFGRSFSLGIADSVTVLAQTAAKADIAATLIANEVDIPNHPSITRAAANSLDPDSDLGKRLVVTGCKELTPDEQCEAILKGVHKARQLKDKGLISGAALFFQNETRLIGSQNLSTSERALNYA